MVQPLTSRSTLTETKLKVIIASCWLAGFIWNTPLYAAVIYREDLRTCGEHWSDAILPVVYSLGWSVVAGVIPISVMGYLYSRVIYKLWFETNPALQSASKVHYSRHYSSDTFTALAVKEFSLPHAS